MRQFELTPRWHVLVGEVVPRTGALPGDAGLDEDIPVRLRTRRRGQLRRWVPGVSAAPVEEEQQDERERAVGATEVVVAEQTPLIGGSDEEEQTGPGRDELLVP